MLIATLLLVYACGAAEPLATLLVPAGTVPLPIGSPMAAPTAGLPSLSVGETLSVRFPLTNSRLLGGYPLRVLLYLVDTGRQGLEGAEVEVKLRSPSGDLFVALPCEDVGQGRYIAGPVRLPMRGSAGTWLVQGQARLEDGRTLQALGSFEGRPSFSEELEEQYGFWLDLSSPLFDYVGPRIVVPSDKYHPYPKGGGIVILANTLGSGLSEIFVILDVHWRLAAFPAEASAATSYVQEIMGPHAMTVERTGLAAQQSRFQDRLAWHVTGLWVEPEIEGQIRPGPSHHPIEWLIFECPQSDWLWTLVISAYREADMSDLRAILGTFQCPNPE